MNSLEEYSDSAKKIAESLIQAVEKNDSIKRDEAVSEIVNILDYLWDLRNNCSDNWGDILNILQGVLWGIQRRKDYNKLDIQITTAIKDTINILLSINLTDDELFRIIEVLTKSGIDLWTLTINKRVNKVIMEKLSEMFSIIENHELKVGVIICTVCGHHFKKGETKPCSHMLEMVEGCEKWSNENN